MAARNVDPQLTANVADFLFEEAGLLDERQFDQWLALYSDDAIYWAPANRLDAKPDEQVAIYHDNHARLKERLARMRSSRFWAQNPPSRTTRTVSNIRVGSRGELLEVESRFILVELRHHRSTTFSGLYRHQLRQNNGDYQICRKEILLIQNNEPFYNLTFIF